MNVTVHVFALNLHSRLTNFKKVQFSTVKEITMKLTIKKSKIKNLSSKPALGLEATPHVAGGMKQVETREPCRSIWACTHPQACFPG